MSSSGDGKKLSLRVLDGELAILQLPLEAPIPGWLDFHALPLVSVTYTAAELTLICPASLVPSEVSLEAGWRAFRVDAKLEFSAVGILSGILAPLAEAGISILSISTFDTDYVLVRTARLEQATAALRAHFRVTG